MKQIDTSLRGKLACGLFGLMALGVGGQVAHAQDLYAEKIQPLLEQRCVACHNQQAPSSGLSVASKESFLHGGARHGSLVQPGNADESVLMKVLRGELQPRMPLGGNPLSDEEIGVIAGWINGLSAAEMTAAPAESTWWALQAPAASQPPAVSARARNGIDNFVIQKLEEKGLSPAPEASKRELLRRVFFDLVGVPPTPSEAQQFLSDNSPDAYEKLVDRLLADPRYGERWGRHWLDLARYADTRGFEGDPELSHAWRYRDYVINAFNKDKPYDRFVKEQIAGDELQAGRGDDDDDDDAPRRGRGGDPEAQIATGFLRVGPRTPNVSRAESRQMTLDEITSTVGSVFLGLTVKCAQCHDHKYDPISQKDYYRFQAFFAPLDLSDQRVPFTDPEIRARVEPLREHYDAELKAAQQKLEQYEAELSAKLEGILRARGDADAKVDERELLSRLIRVDAGNVTASQDRTFTEEEKDHYLELLAPVDPRNPTRGRLLRQLARHEPVAHSVRNFSGNAALPNRPVTHVLINGEFDKVGEYVEPGFLSVIEGHSEPALLPTQGFGDVSAYRSVLADWIVSPENPLTARVMANRIWQYHFGTGIVGTSSDFGKNGARPTHPELLDWLAVKFVEQDWSIKSMHRLIMNSATYRQSSTHWSQAAADADSENTLLWRMNRRRLEAEAIRDSVLAVSGRLNAEQGGPGVYPVVPEEVANTRIKARLVWEPPNGVESLKRSIYIMQRRSLEVPMLNVMDALALNESCSRRFVSTTALQALTLMNGVLVTEESQHFAQRLAETAGPDPTDQIELAFQLAFSRPPEDEELRKARDYLSTGGDLVGLARILFNTNEFVYVR